MTEPVCTAAPDLAERRRAVDIRRSFIVQAPAGSGKTELLVQRILALLAVSGAPEEVLAITFTRKAAGEMRQRLLEALERAGDDQPPQQDHARETWHRARQVLAADRREGWHLKQNPSRLQLMTIDSLCALLTRRMPWLSGFGALPRINEQPEELYLAAAESLISRLDGDPAGQAAVESLVAHLDNRMVLLRDMLVSMLGRRDQWLRHMLGQRSAGSRAMLEEGLRRYITSTLVRTRSTLGPETCRSLEVLGAYAAANLGGDDPHHPMRRLCDSFMLSAGIDDLPAWLGIAHMVLTSAGTIRKSVDKRTGFPADKTPLAMDMKSRMGACLEQLREKAHARDCLLELRQLPAATYAPDQWRILEALVDLLPLAVMELREMFRSRGEVDFIEIAGAAQAALGDADNPEDLLLQMDSRISHILVDEFQDTSYAQFALLQKLVAGWTPGDGRTLFLVGDPMQSIYRFREAEVGLFLRACEQGLNDLPLERIQLTANFRSQAMLVDWANLFFADLFPEREDQVRGAVRFSPASAVRSALDDEAVFFHGYIDRQDRLEAERVVELVRQSLRDNQEASIAVLVRSRNHLVEIVNALKQAGLRFQAQDIDPLTDRPVVQDLLALTRALLHPADRVAWLAVLRAPWCGLCLDDLLAVCGRDQGATLGELLNAPQDQAELFERISDDGRKRLDRVLGVLDHARQRKGSLSLRSLVESTWLALGGPACVDEAGRADARQVFLLLERLDDGGDLERFDLLEQRLGSLFAAVDPLAGPELQVMTIHKAKGLEFDTVILPGIGRGIRPPDRALLRWIEHPDYELLLAPVPPAAGDAEDPTYRAIGQILKDKDDLETLRLFYVAATRARNRLHLLGHYRLDAAGRPSPVPGSFLEAVWPAAAARLTADAVGGSGGPQMEAIPLRLQRLPLEWALPAMPGRVSPAAVSVRRASDHERFGEEPLESRLSEEGRVVGNLVHAWLQRIAQEGPEQWPVPRLKSRHNWLESQLFSQGIPAHRHEPCLARVVECMAHCLKCTRGQWLLAGHPGAHCEFAINGLVDGELVHAVIDRTFVDRGVRWVIDYKTSRPGRDEQAGEFLEREMARYEGQLMMYRTLMRAWDPEHPVRAALYFPVPGLWQELAEASDPEQGEGPADGRR